MAEPTAADAASKTTANSFAANWRMRCPSSLAYPALALCFVAVGVLFRVAHPQHAVPWYDEFRTLLHASGHSYDDLAQLLSESEPVTAGEIQGRFLMPSAERGLLQSFSLAQELDPHNSPLYYGLVRLALRDGVAPLPAARQLSAWLSVLWLPAGCWLAWELFRSLRVACISVAFLAVAPVIQYWAFEARCYVLWGLATACSCAALLRALRTQTRRWWVAYACISACATYTHLLNLPVLGAHLVYVGLRARPSLRTHGVAVGVILLLLLPWLLWIASAWEGHVAPQIAWTGGARHPSYWHHLSYAIGHGLWFSFDVFSGNNKVALVLGLLMSGAAVMLFAREHWRSPGLLLLSLFTAVLLPMAAMDLLFGGIRLAVVRYLVPSSLALVLIFTGVLGCQPNLVKRAVAFVLLFSAGVHSWRAAQDELPEGKWRSEPTTIAGIKHVLEEARDPLVVSLGQVALPATLSMTINSDVPFVFLENKQDFAKIEALASKRDVFVIDSRYLPWYYEPYASRTDSLIAELRSEMALVPVTRGLLRIRAAQQG